MTDTAFTPGPYWTSPDRNPADASDALVYDVGAGDQCLATFQRRADAMLYRAAPDLLAALDGLICNGFTDEALARRWSWSVDSIRTARAAFAKATA